jgi:hypothetical protein
VALLKEAALGRGQGVMEVSVGKGKKGELWGSLGNTNTHRVIEVAYLQQAIEMSHFALEDIYHAVLNLQDQQLLVFSMPDLSSGPLSITIR